MTKFKFTTIDLIKMAEGSKTPISAKDIRRYEQADNLTIQLPNRILRRFQKQSEHYTWEELESHNEFKIYWVEV